MLGKIETNGADILDDSFQLWRSSTITLWHIDAGERELSTPSSLL
jgi:hypothetical protein